MRQTGHKSRAMVDRYARQERKDSQATLAGRAHRCCHCPGHRRPRPAEPQHRRPVRQEEALMATFQSDSYPRTRQIRSTKVGGSNPLQMRSGEDFGAGKNPLQVAWGGKRGLGLVVERLVLFFGATKNMRPQSSGSRAAHRLFVCLTQSPYSSCRQLLVLRALFGPDRPGRLETLLRRLCLRDRFPRQ
jgi:hypothetical protein